MRAFLGRRPAVPGAARLAHPPARGPPDASGHGPGRTGSPAPASQRLLGVGVRDGMTLAEIGGLPVVTDLVTAGRALGMGRTKAYELARAGQFPCPVIRVGKSYLVPTAGLLALLGLPIPTPPPPDHTP